MTERIQEIGVRMALGASRRDVLRMVLSRGARVALAGVVCGVGAALVLARVQSHLVYGVSASDPAIFASVPFVLAAVALLATYIPARRATRVDPVVALRQE